MREPIQFDEQGRDPSGLALCQVCGYPYRGAKCDNPGCRSNRSAEQNARDDAQRTARAAQDAERQRIAAVRTEAMKPLATRAKEALAKLPEHVQAQHRAAWARVEAAVRDLASRPVGRHKPKVFEVHHAVEHARTLYLTELAAFHAADHCERVVMAAYFPKES